jgi:hypothetical protein
MFFKHHALNRLSLVVGIASLFGAAAGGPLASTKRHQLPDTGIGIVSSHIVNRALKADKLAVPSRTRSSRKPNKRLAPTGAVLTSRSDASDR